ncbi:pyridoxamine 5'-phosphate oxidase family protein [Salinisphaera sp. SPP-AMP-43]|uniref:pyridoxamine 5'-phosphate oxidase family protein n=1 Tax=Salinisphaera sp. SPP-AMP-43 TaxID=3121288 RepID=UPI003C6E52A3
MHTDEGRITELDEATCRQLLASHRVGRIAINAEPSPEVLPVDYALRSDGLIFHSGLGTKQAAAARGQAATFQVDGVDMARRAGWSVMVRGRLVITDESESPELPEPLPGGERPYVVHLSLDTISGRRIPPERGWLMPGRVWHGQDATDLMG